MRQNREDNYRQYNRDWNDEPRSLHEPRHGENSDRGNYTVDSRFHPGTGRAFDKDFYDDRTFNSNADHSYTYPQGRFQVGGANYSGDDYSRQNQRYSDDNPYGMSYTGDDGYNSSRHYDPRANYSNRDYDDIGRKGRPSERTGMADEKYGHDIRRGRGDDRFLGHSSYGDYESYRRYEHGNDMYDNDYRGGFAGRNHTEGRPHFGEDRSYSNLDGWYDRSDRRNDRYDQHRGDRR